MAISFSKTTLRARIKDFDWVMVLITLLLLVYGVLVIYSTSISGSSISSIARNQIIFAGFGLFLFIAVSLFNYKSFKGGAIYLYILTLILLGLVLVLGRTTYGAVRWLNIGGFQLQPSEFAKLFLVIVLAKFFSSRSEEGGIKPLILSGLYTLVPVILVILQPDLGTALVFVAIWVGMILVSNIKKIYLLALAGLGALCLPLFWNFLRDYQKQRIITFFNPQADPLGKGYNVLQSIIATGSGRLFGRGLGYGYQSQLKFLPIQHTDFIFAVLAEELGFVGAVVLLALFFILLFRIIKITFQSSDSFGMYLGVGIFSMIVFQVLINIGMNMGIMPVAGVPLPLISAGGSSLLTVLLSLGILESIALRRRKIIF
jgi:rod shape determining protein RodA